MADLSFEELSKARTAVSSKLDRAMNAKRKDWARIGELYAAQRELDREISDLLRACE